MSDLALNLATLAVGVLCLVIGVASLLRPAKVESFYNALRTKLFGERYAARARTNVSERWSAILALMVGSIAIIAGIMGVVRMFGGQFT
ncbi:hypothetical protein ACPPVQ_13640 [Diaminobutyricibacter sp. McL0618]|uniref:hypothetical protein n=1 Tax=Leifsonia sp. McL0618 TaxID=3415677 RepID=UPI003CF5189C